MFFVQFETHACMQYINNVYQKIFRGVISQNIFVSLGSWEILPRACYVMNQAVMVSPSQKTQQLRRAEVLARNRLAVKQPITSKSCDTEKQLSKSAQPNEPHHINSQGEVAPERLCARNEEKKHSGREP